MQSASRFHLFVSTLTVTVMFLALKFLLPRLDLLLASSPWATGLLTFLGSVGAYKFLAAILSLVQGRSTLVKSWVMGPSFLHGTWVGYFVGHSNEVRYVVEHFEQDLDGLVIRGWSFTEDEIAHAQWASESTTVDVIRGRLTYISGCDILTRKETVQSVCIFQFHRKSSSDAAHSIQGYVVDVNDGQRLAVTEKKVSTELLGQAEAISFAKDLATKSLSE